MYNSILIVLYKTYSSPTVITIIVTGNKRPESGLIWPNATIEIVVWTTLLLNEAIVF